MARTVRGWKLSSGFRKAPYLDQCYLNIFLCDLFQLSVDLDITNYADDSTPHSTNITLNKVLHDLEKLTNTLFK